MSGFLLLCIQSLEQYKTAPATTTHRSSIDTVYRHCLCIEFQLNYLSSSQIKQNVQRNAMNKNRYDDLTIIIYKHLYKMTITF